MPNNHIRVFAPATVANVSCGFDILGFAISSPGDEIEIKLTKRSRNKNLIYYWGWG